jgi:hypothetical protein
MSHQSEGYRTVRLGLRWLARERETSWRFTLAVCASYLLFLIWMHVHHEMWRDEIHGWTLARLACSFGDLVTGDRAYEGHPPLWFWYLRIWAWLVKSAAGVQVATITAAVGAALLLVRFAPFPRYLKLLLLFSYYFGYEYTVLSRNYVLGWLLACVFCALYHPMRVRHLMLGACLALLSLTSFYGLALSLFLGVWLVADLLRVGPAPGASAVPRALCLSIPLRLMAGLAIFAAALVFCALTLEPPDANPLTPHFVFEGVTLAEVPKMLYRVAAGFLPWRRFSMDDFWARSFTFWEASSPWSACLGAAILLVAIAALYPCWRLMLAYLAMVAGILIFQQARDEGLPRHWGHFFVGFLLACWLVRATYPHRPHRWSTALLAGICLVQIQAFVVATVIDTRHVFSGGRETAAFIRGTGLQDLPIIAGPDFNVLTVAGFLERPFHSAETEEFNQTAVYHSRRRAFSPDLLMARAIAVARAQRCSVLLVSNQPLPDPPAGVIREQLFQSRPGTIADEIFTVYRLVVR